MQIKGEKLGFVCELKRDNRWQDGENLACEIVGITKQETGGRQEHTRTL